MSCSDAIETRKILFFESRDAKSEVVNTTS